jgi:PhoH-like ATPase
MNKNAVLIDTSVLIHEPTSFLDFIEKGDVLIPIYVIMELDVLKDKKSNVSHLARRSSNLILKEIDKNSSVKVISHTEELDLKSLSKATEIRYVDLLILKTAEKYSKDYESFTLLTKDINLRILSESVGIKSADYVNSKPSENILEKGTRSVEPNPMLKSKLLRSYWEGDSRLTEEEAKELDLENNEYLLIEDQKQKNHIFRYNNHTLTPVKKKETTAGGVKPRNSEQVIALDLLLNEEVKLVALLGKAGTGKTFLTLASALHQSARYQRILLSKPVVDVGNGIGFLPGTVGEKLEPWMQSFFDNLDQINPYWDTDPLGREKESYFEKNHIEIQPINSIRGRSLKNAFMIIDEAQNLTKHEIKSIITRAAEGTKVVLLGDPYQIDNPYLDANSNGLIYVVEKMKGQSIFGFTSLTKSERSELSDIAADLL